VQQAAVGGVNQDRVEPREHGSSRGRAVHCDMAHPKPPVVRGGWLLGENVEVGVHDHILSLGFRGHLSIGFPRPLSSPKSLPCGSGT
jgi:hypothetical protein